MKISEALSERRSNIVRQTLALVNHSGPLSAEQRQRLNALRADMDYLEDDLKTDAQRKHDRSFRSWLRHGMNASSSQRGVSAEDRELLRGFEARDMGTGNSGAGLASSGAGIFVPIGFRAEVDSNLKYATPLLDPDLTTIVDTPTGQILPFITDDDTSVSAELVPEGQQVTGADVATIGSANLKSYKFGSRLIKVSIELATDEGIDFGAYLARRFAARFGRGLAPYLTTGTGTAQPKGFMTSAQNGGGVAAGAGTNDGVSGGNTIGSGDLAVLESSLDYAWRPRASWMCHPSTLQRLRAQLDKQGRRVFPELAHSTPDGLMLGGYPLKVNPQMDQLQSQVSSPPITRTPLAFGDFSQFAVRRTGFVMMRLSERFSDLGQVAFLAWWRYDSALLQASAIQTMQTVY